MYAMGFDGRTRTLPVSSWTSEILTVGGVLPGATCDAVTMETTLAETGSEW